MLDFTKLTESILDDRDRAGLALASQMNLWTINGGYIAAIALRAAGQRTRWRDPVSISVDFIRPAKVGDASVEVDVQASNLGSDLIAVTVAQDDKVRAIARVWAADDRPGPIHHQAEMPLVPHPLELRTLQDIMTPGEPEVHGFWDVFEQRPINRIDNKSRRPRPSRYLRWFRYSQSGTMPDRFASMARVLPIIDVLGVSSADQMYDGPFLTSLAPTVQLSVHFRDTSYDGDWLLCDALCEYAEHGLISAQVKVWGLHGELVAHGMTQMLIRPGSGAYVGAPNEQGAERPPG